MEQYETWAEAEKFFLPEFEEEAEAVEAITEDRSQIEPEKPVGRIKEIKDDASSSDLSQMLLNKLNFKKEPDAASITSTGTHSAAASRSSSRSSRTSPECVAAQLTPDEAPTGTTAGQANGVQRSSTVPTVPMALRPLLSALLWRLHSGPDASNPAKACILVTNDRTTQSWAQKFGIATKNIHQLRTAIQYEEKEYKNRCKYVEKTQAAEPKPLLSYENDSDEDELVFVPRGRGKGATTRGGNARGGNNRKPAVKNTIPAPETTIEIPSQPIDPDSFSRNLRVVKQPTVDLSSQAGAARGLAGASRRYSGGRRGAPRGPSRGSSRGRGKLWVP